MDEIRGDRAKVLVVDDEPFMVRSIERLLSSQFDVTGVTGGEAALALFRAGARFDAILCDFAMPDMTGMEVFAEIARTAPDQARRFAIVTGGAFLPGAQELLAECSCQVLDKPFTRSELLESVRALLRASATPPAEAAVGGRSAGA